jgi:hypothetical protein
MTRRINEILLKEELDEKDIMFLKGMINRQLKKLFYTLYIKNAFWEVK